MEIEAKFSFREESAFAGWLTAPSLARFVLGPVRTKHTADEYLDSVGCSCLRGGYACRIRADGGKYVATLKSLDDTGGAPVPGVRRRDELEVELEPPEEAKPAAATWATAPDWQQPQAWPESEARSLALRLLGGEPLRHLVWIYQERHERTVLDGDRALALCSLDRVQLDGDRPAMLELEVELTDAGAEDELAEIAAVLRTDPAFEPVARSKLQRALDGLIPFPAAGAAQPGHAPDAAPDGASVHAFDCARLDALCRALLETVELADEQRAGAWLAGATALLQDGARARPEDPGAAARDLLLAGDDPRVPPADRPLVAALLGLQSILDEQLREGERLRLGERRCRSDPACTALRGGDVDAARGLGVLLFTARLLDDDPKASVTSLPVTVTERLVLLAGDFSRLAEARGLGRLWRKRLGRRLVLRGRAGNGTPGLRYDQPLAAAGRMVLREQLQRLRTGLDGLDSDDPIEALHDARVATRRMRTLLKLLKLAYPRRPRRHHLAALKRLGDLLGAVRDLDVQIAALDPAVAEHGGAGFAALRTAWTRERDRRYAALQEYAGSDRFTAWLAEFDRFLHAGSTGKEGASPLCEVLPALGWQGYGIVRSYQPRVPDAPLATLHELRKDLKQLRYLLEFFSPLLGGDSEAIVEQIITAQDALGVLHDADARRAHLDAMQAETTVPTSVIEAYRLRTLSEIPGLRRAFEERWPSLVDRHFRRHLGRLLAEI